MGEAKVARCRDSVKLSQLLSSVDGVVDGRSMTEGQDLASIDGVHYSEVVYDAMAQVVLNQLHTRWQLSSGAKEQPPVANRSVHTVCENADPLHGLWILGITAVM